MDNLSTDALLLLLTIPLQLDPNKTSTNQVYLHIILLQTNPLFTTKQTNVLSASQKQFDLLFFTIPLSFPWKNWFSLVKQIEHLQV